MEGAKLLPLVVGFSYSYISGLLFSREMCGKFFPEAFFLCSPLFCFPLFLLSARLVLCTAYNSELHDWKDLAVVATVARNQAQPEVKKKKSNSNLVRQEKCDNAE